MVVRTQAPAAAGKLRQKHRSIFICCLAAPDTHSDSGDSAYIKDTDNALASQQQPLSQWKQLQQQQQQQEDQQSSAIRTVTISSSATPSDTSNDVTALQQHQQQQCTPNAARSLVTRAAPSTTATYNSTLPSRTVTPLTDLSVVPTTAAKTTAAATAISSSTVGQAFSKASRSIQQCGTGDSPSEIHSDLAAEHHLQQQQQQQQGGVQAGSTNSPVRRLDSHSVSRSISGSCHATASSAGSSSSSVVGPAAAALAEVAAAKACGSGRAEQVVALSPAGPADCDLEGLTKEHGSTIPNTADAQGIDQSDVPSDSTPLEACAGGLHREISLSPAAGAAATQPPPPAPAAAVESSSSTSGDNNPDSEEVAVAAAGRTFRFSNSGSFPILAAAAADSPSSNTAAASPFAQLSLQKAVANTLLSSARQQQSAKRADAATMPASVASFHTAASTSAATAAGVRVSSSSGPAALAGGVSWATASTVLGADPSEVFEVLDPEAASVDDGHKMLKRSASASSVSALGSSSSTGRNKLQQIRSAMSFGGAASKSKAAAAAAADSSNQDDQAAAAAAAPGSSNSGFKKVWRCSTHHQATGTCLKGPDSSATVARRSKSAHESILAQQQQQQQQRGRQLSDQGLPPPYPSAAAAAASTAAGRHSSSLGSSGRLASGEVQSSCSSIGLGASGSSSSPDLGTHLDRHRLSMGSAPAKTGDGSGSTGSLLGLAVTRMHTARSAPVLSSMPTSSSSASSSAPSGLSSMGSMTSSSSSLAPAAMSPGRNSIDLSRASSMQIANAFADAFLAALAAGNTKWASQGAVAQMVHDSAKMLGLDKQLYVGKTAIIRRLNGGMDQLVKMVGAYVDNSSSSSSGGGDGGKGPDQSNVMSDLATQMPKPLLSVTCPDPKTKPSTVVALYTFKWGIRKFTLRDEFIVKNGQIMRLRRSRS